MMRRSQRIRPVKRLPIEVAGGVPEVVPEAEGEAVLEVVDEDVEEEGASRLESWQALCHAEIILRGPKILGNSGTVCCKECAYARINWRSR